MSGSDEEKIHRTVERVARESPEVCADRTAEVSGAARRRGSPKTPQFIRPVLLLQKNADQSVLRHHRTVQRRGASR
jgi:hypothetical protein